MIKKLLLSLSFVLLVVLGVGGYEQIRNPKQETHYIKFPDLPAAYGAVYFGGQPDQAAIKTLKGKGFEVVINIRGRDEVPFDEKKLVEDNGLAYYNLPLLPDGEIMDTAVTESFNAIKNNEGKKILLHCTSGNRVAGWFGAHLVRDMGYDKEAAITLARQAGMTKSGMETILREYLDNPAK